MHIFARRHPEIFRPYRAALGVALALGIVAGTGRALAADSIEPHAALTPGRIMVDRFDHQPLTREQICHVGYSRSVRRVPIELKRDVYAEYGVTYVRGEHEVDHLVPLSLGGSNDEANLWPEPSHGPWNSFVKDRLEFRLHELVCAGSVPLAQAQHEIATDWVAAYKKYVGAVPLEAHVREEPGR
jgi:hypothetical protein